MIRRRLVLSGLGALALLGGCASGGGPFPSLALRPAEQEDWVTEPSHPTPVTADDPAIRTRLATALRDAHAGERAFEADWPAAEAAARRGGAQGSDAWVEAQQDISRLEAARAQTSAAAAELHQLRQDRAVMATSSADLAAIDAAIAEIAGLADREQDRINRLNRR
jgi:hypothetical protein